VVVIVIGVLAAAGIAKYQDFAEVARKRTCTSNQSQIDKAVGIFSTSDTPMPSSAYGLMMFATSPPGRGYAWSASGAWPSWVNGDQIAKVVADPKVFLCSSSRTWMEKNSVAVPNWNWYVGACYGNNMGEGRSNYVLYYQSENYTPGWQGATAFWYDTNAGDFRRQYVWCGSFGGYNCPGPSRNVAMRHSSNW
jgi:hypothetical protein